MSISREQIAAAMTRKKAMKGNQKNGGVSMFFISGMERS
jgi:hypothetical protein